MPKTRENLIHLYWDKAVLLILAAVGIYVFLGRVISSPIEIGSATGPKQTPQQLVEDMSRGAAVLKEKIERATPPETQLPSYVDAFRARLNGALPSNLPRNPLTLQGPGVKELPRLVCITTPPVLAPLKVRGRAGIGLIAPAPEGNRSTTQPVISASGTETYWITVAAEFPFYRQYLAFAGLDPLVDKESCLPVADQRFLFARVDLQRQELLPDGSWSKAEDINPYELYRQNFPNTVKNLIELYSLSSDEEQSGNADALKAWLSRDGFQEFIVRPEFFPLVGFEQWYWPEPSPDLADDRSPVGTLAGELPKRDEAPKYRVVRAVTPQNQLLQVDRGRPNALLPGPTDLRGGILGPDRFPVQQLPQRRSSESTLVGRRRTDRVRRIRIPQDYRQGNEQIEMWAHDSSVVPGRTYRYRMRVLLFNPLCGRERAESGKARTLAWLEGPWSTWSDPVQALRKRSFYFTGVSPGRGSKPPRARVTVYAWQDGWWYEHLFFYSDAGSIIGGPVDVPQFVLGDGRASIRSADAFRVAPRTSGTRTTSARRGTRPEGPGPRPRVRVDFATGWSIVDFTPEMQLNRPVDKESTTFEAVSTAELVVMEQETKQLVKRYAVIDSDDLHRKELEQIVARQEAAFRDMQRQLDRRTRPTATPDRSRRRPGLGAPPSIRPP
ncbi:MAG: hypothetical protein GWP14_02960 [Actinobacteria bacterium]|nr:hypothetical protein [Actinomycetota bacterium]